MTTALLITPELEDENVIIEIDNTDVLRSLYSAIDCTCVSIVYGVEGSVARRDGLIGWADEEALCRNDIPPFNAGASAIFGHGLVGNIVVTGDTGTDIADLPDGVLHQLEAVGLSVRTL